MYVVWWVVEYRAPAQDHYHRAAAPAAGIKSGERRKAKTTKMAGQYHKL
jgi:hypothetical protein